jgi:ATP-binding cassette subfamily F protein uup
MHILEAEKKTIAEKMSLGNLGFEELQKLSDRLIVINKLLEEKELKWLELSEMM